MEDTRSWSRQALCAAIGGLLGLAVSAGGAFAKPWAIWAPAPLGSDSSYAALAAREWDSLGAEERAWEQVQRDWRAQRAGEAPGARRGIMSDAPAHKSRAGDSLFATLASRPYAALSDLERAWLVEENAAQHPGHKPLGLRGAVRIAGVVAAGAVFAAALLLAVAFHSMNP